MNTIKEQATVNVTAKDVESYETGFTVGANYVIDKIEELLTKYSSHIINKAFIRELIEQLKGNK